MATRTDTIGRSVVASAVLAAVLVVGGARSSQAQSAQTDPRWQAWLGCWEASTDAQAHPLIGSAQLPMMCVLPVAGASTVDVVNVVDGKVTQRQRVATTGQRVQGTKQSCNGWDSAEWSASGKRVYLRSEYTCPGDIKRATSGVIAIAPTGEWLDVEAVASGGNSGVRVARYREARNTASLPTEIMASLDGMKMASGAARTAAAASLTDAEIVEAAHHLDARVMQAWLVEREEGFSLDAKRLTQFSDAGVPSDVIDVMVALTYPRVFAVNRRTLQGEYRQPDADQRVVVGSGRTVGPIYADWDPFFGYDAYSRYGYGYSAYGYSPYGYSPFGYNNWYVGNRPIVVVVRGSPADQTPAPEGRAVKGRGYTRGTGDGSSSGSARPSGSSGGSSSGSSGSSGSTGSTSSGSTRTAHPRP
jgi:hypothetical protein